VDAKYSRKKTIIRNRNGARKYSLGGGGKNNEARFAL